METRYEFLARILDAAACINIREDQLRRTTRDLLTHTHTHTREHTHAHIHASTHAAHTHTHTRRTRTHSRTPHAHARLARARDVKYIQIDRVTVEHLL